MKIDSETHLAVLVLVVALLCACGSDADDSPVPPEQGAALDAEPAFAGCERAELEPDLAAMPLAGPGVQNGSLAPGQYIVSSTYLQLKQDAASQQLFQELVTPVLGELQARPGLMAVSLASSDACGVVRTLAVWQDDVAMLDFVTSPAHAAAMAGVTDISRGGSTVTHWLGAESSADWPSAASHLGADDGPLY